MTPGFKPFTILLKYDFLKEFFVILWTTAFLVGWNGFTGDNLGELYFTWISTTKLP